MRFLTASALLALATFGAAAESADSLARYLPEIHGAMRGRWEILTDDGRNRFQLRNARVILSGNLARRLTIICRPTCAMPARWNSWTDGHGCRWPTTRCA